LVLDLFGFFSFGLGSLVVVLIFLFYYNKIPKSNNSESQLTNRIYQKIYILPQLSSNDANFRIKQSFKSTLVKVLIFVLIAFVVLIPVNQLFGVVNSIC
jgi:hypothetical protein